MKSAIIAGTGIYQLEGITLEPQVINTTYGEALVYLCAAPYENLVFLARHGIEHHTPPHKINYRANLKALKMLGVERILATNAVGSISREIPPGGLALMDDFLDFTSGRQFTFFDGGKSGLAHTDMSQPYCPALRQQVLQVASQLGLNIRPTGTYVATNGPRFETPAEIRMYSHLGGDVVGMTGVPEVVLARELGMHYAAVAFSINWAAGLENEIGFVHGADQETLKSKLVRCLVQTLTSDFPLSCSCEKSVMITHPPSS